MNSTEGAWAFSLSEQEDGRLRATVIHVSPAQPSVLRIAHLVLAVGPAVDLLRSHLDEAARALHADESSCAS